MKKKQIIYILLIILLGGLLVIFKDSIFQNSNFIKLNYEEIKEKVNNKDSFILCVSRTKCSHCQNYKPKLSKVAKEYNIVIYYTEIDKYDDNEYEEEHTLLEHINVERTACGIWQAYLLSMAPTVLPTFWHGGYIRRTYIFSHKDLEEIDELRRNGKAPLFGIKDIVSPKVKIRGSEGTIECCYWNDWEGLVRETLKVTYANNSVISITQTKAEVLCEYDCGICF